MKRVLFVLTLVASAAMIMAQDVIMSINGEKINAKVLEVKKTCIEYINLNAQDDSVRTMRNDLIFSVNYADGKIKVIQKADPTCPLLQNTNSNRLITRKRNTYLYDHIPVERAMYEQILKQNCTAAYEKYRRGYVVSSVGWATFAAGYTLYLVGYGYTIYSLSLNDSKYDPSYDPYYGETESNQLRKKYETIGLSLAGTSSVMLYASIPMLIVGYKQMHRSASIYNQHAQQPQAYWSINASQNGIGLALNF